jgi:hypothetical protein
MAMTTAQIATAIETTLTEFSNDYAGLTFLNDEQRKEDLQNRLETALDAAASD